MNSQWQRRALATRLACRCRAVVEDVLFDWEIADIDREFFDVILEELQQSEEADNAHR